MSSFPMNAIDSIKTCLRTLSELAQVSREGLADMKARYPGVPDEYTEFLGSVGYGDVGDIRIYEGLTSASDIYPKPQADLSHIKLFGDDFQGYCFGFDTENGYSLVEVDPRGNIRPRTEGNFLSLIASYVTD